MAQKRMFDRAIIDTDRFMDLSMSAKALYFLLGMEADDEGFVSYKKVMRIHGGNEDDVKILIVKNFLISFQSGVVVITDWNNNNYLDKNRIRETEYQKEKKMLLLTDTGKYELNNGLTSIVESSIVQNRIEESNSDVKPSQKEKSFNPLGAEVIKAFETVDPKNKTYYGNKTQRASCDFLISEYSLEKTLAVIKILPQANAKKLYIGKITSPYDLKENWVKLVSVLTELKTKQREVIL